MAADFRRVYFCRPHRDRMHNEFTVGQGTPNTASVPDGLLPGKCGDESLEGVAAHEDLVGFGPGRKECVAGLE